jgi:predicted RNase H-like HicB family nuclease
MFATYTAKYTKITTGYMGQLVEWPEIVTEGRDIEDCRGNGNGVKSRKWGQVYV